MTDEASTNGTTRSDPTTGPTTGMTTGMTALGGTPRPLALVTGASSGIGTELAAQLAQRGFDLVVTAEDDTLAVVAEALRADGCDVRAVQVDLRTADGVAQLWDVVTGTGRPLEVAALNAGVGLGGAFLDTDVEDEVAMVQLNVVSTLRLAKPVVRSMAARGAGRVLVTSSIASTMPGSFQSVYNATKSFLQSWTEALQEELAGTGVTMTALMPGPTETNFFVRAGMEGTRVGQADKDDPADVARQGLDALLDGKAKVLASSRSTKLQGVLSAVLPDSVKAKVHRRVAEPGQGA